MPADQHIAENLFVEESEDGFELHITTEAGLFIFNIQGVTKEFLTASSDVVNYWAEGEMAAARHVTDDEHSVSVERLSDLWDQRRGK